MTCEVEVGLVNRYYAMLLCHTPYVIQMCYARSHDPSQVQCIWPGLSKSGMVQPGNGSVNQTTLDYEHCTSRWVQM